MLMRYVIFCFTLLVFVTNVFAQGVTTQPYTPTTSVVGKDGVVYIPAMRVDETRVIGEGEVVYFNQHCVFEKIDFWHVRRVCSWSGGVRNEMGVIKEIPAGNEQGEPSVNLGRILVGLSIITMSVATILPLSAAASFVFYVITIISLFMVIAGTLATHNIIVLLTVALAFAIAFAMVVTNQYMNIGRMWVLLGIYVSFLGSSMYFM